MNNHSRILAINTTTRECSVALLSNGQSYVATEYSERGHDGIVLILIDQVLEQANLKKSDIELLAFGRGPGAFTGIRVATAVTQGLAVGLGVKVIPVSDLANIAYQHYKTSGEKTMAACFDARMGEIYAGVFTVRDDYLSSHQNERLSKPKDWEFSDGIAVGVGNGFIEFPELIAQLQINEDRSNFELFPTALASAELAVSMIKNGFEPVDAIDALPVYLRNDVAHRK